MMEPRRGILADRSPAAALALAVLLLTQACCAADSVLSKLPEGVLRETVSVSAGSGL